MQLQPLLDLLDAVPVCLTSAKRQEMNGPLCKGPAEHFCKQGPHQENESNVNAKAPDMMRQRLP